MTDARPAVRNRLGNEVSPYLLQHKDNPVAWQPWDEEAFELARACNRPILLSVGYAACHWCHVMAHESFEDPETAAVMNELFINIKVDREERPDIDNIYMTALQALGQHGGWPMTMFLTPEGEPFWGGTYFPNQPRHGLPAFRDVLQQVAKVYREQPDAVRQNCAALINALSRLGQGQQGNAVTPQAADEVAQRLLDFIDMEHGGIQGAPKFPNPSILWLLWQTYLRTGNQTAGDAVHLTLTRMSQGGIYDHIGGGFARYAVDEHWLVPHFEKMLYDNAQILHLLTDAWRDSHALLYRQRVEETVAWLAREMVVDGGGFASSLDADSEGEEGRFYLWSEAELDRALGPRSQEFKTIYGVRTGGNFDGRSVLNRLADPRLGDEELENRLVADRATLFAIRERRTPPARDDKVLADWNGLAIAALARAAACFDRPDWRELALGAYRFVVDRMTREGRLCHAYRAGKSTFPALLDDYATMIDAAIALYETGGDITFLQQAEAWTATVDRDHWDSADGGYFLTAADATDVLVRAKTCMDGATPAGNGMMASALARLYHLTGKTAYRDRAEAIVRAFSGALQRDAFGLSSLLSAVILLEEAEQLIITGPPADEATRRLLLIAYRTARPALVVQFVLDTSSLPRDHPAHGKAAINGKATAYLCRGPVCGLPILDAATLEHALTEPGTT